MLYIDDVDCLAYSNGQEIKYVNDPRGVLFIVEHGNNAYPFQIVGGKIQGYYKYSNVGRPHLIGQAGKTIDLVDRPQCSVRSEIITILKGVEIPANSYILLKRGLYVFNITNEPIDTLLYNGRIFCDSNLKLIYSSGPFI